MQQQFVKRFEDVEGNKENFLNDQDQMLNDVMNFGGISGMVKEDDIVLKVQTGFFRDKDQIIESGYDLVLDAAKTL